MTTDAQGLRAEVLRIGEDEYHADPCEMPSLSQSIANVLLDRTPLHAWHRHPKLGGGTRAPSKAMDRGSLIHKLLLGAGPRIEVVDAKDWRTKVAREARDTAREAGRIPVLAGDYEGAVEASAVIAEKLADRGVRFSGDCEKVVAWQEATPHGPIWCRGMIDHVVGSQIDDLKTTRDAKPEKLERRAPDYGYEMQAAAYTRAIAKLRPELEGRIGFRFAFVEPDPPYAVTVAKLDGVLRRRGERRWVEAVERWAGCLARDSWPGYADETVVLNAPPWVLSQEMEAM